MTRPFLTARWSNLILITYSVPPEMLEKRLAPGLSLDMRDGMAFVSLVGFQFLDTRVCGVSWPGNRNFAELNLRFYVRHGTERGVMFIREFVPRLMIAWMAKGIYNEPYQAAPLTDVVTQGPEGLEVAYTLQHSARIHTLSAESRKATYHPPEDSAEHFFKEHRWGFGMTRGGQTIRYEVVHPAWDVYPVDSYRVDLDWSAVYGSDWGILQTATPYSVVLAAGSPVAVYPKGKLVAR
jgi:uncharacterized protein YqjF (DUF2071 family)